MNNDEKQDKDRHALLKASKRNFVVGIVCLLVYGIIANVMLMKFCGAEASPLRIQVLKTLWLLLVFYLWVVLSWLLARRSVINPIHKEIHPLHLWNLLMKSVAIGGLGVSPLALIWIATSVGSFKILGIILAIVLVFVIPWSPISTSVRSLLVLYHYDLMLQMQNEETRAAIRASRNQQE